MMRSGRLRLLLLFVVVITFAASAVVAFQRHKQTADIISISGKTTAWTVVRMESEYLKFLQLLHKFALKDVSVDELQQRFDILWSRTDILLVGNESEELRKQQGVKALIQSLQKTLAEIEDTVFQLKPGKTAEYYEIRDKLEPFYVPLRQVVVDNFRGTQAHFSLQKANDIQREIGFYLLGLFISGTILIGFVLHENRNNRRQALHDSLTGLPNRLHFSGQLQRALHQALREQKQFAVHVIDLNGFKEVNDTLGHAIGDVLLKHVAGALASGLRTHDIVARLGGDEFAIIQTDITNLDMVAALAERMSENIGREVEVQGNSCFVSASIGISVYPQDTDSANQLLINADMAMYRAKTAKDTYYRFFEQEMNSAILRRKALSDDLRKAIASDSLKLVYQPILDLQTGKAVAVEALLRWKHECYGDISPLEIVPIAEMYGQAIALNEWVLRNACQQIQDWRQKGLLPIQVAVNISPGMYAHGQLVEAVNHVLNQTGLRGEDLVIEVTEDTTMRDIDASPDILKALRELGVELALDDFGTGHSSLSHLKQLPVQRLKIDKSFVKDLDKTPEDIQFIHTIIQLGQSLGMKIVAEGIETAEILLQMQREHCEFGQGYYFCRPSTPENIEKYLRVQNTEMENRSPEPVYHS